MIGGMGVIVIVGDGANVGVAVGVASIVGKAPRVGASVGTSVAVCVAVARTMIGAAEVVTVGVAATTVDETAN